MINVIPFDAGSNWGKIKAKAFDLFFSELHISYDWENPKDITFLPQLKSLKGLVVESTKSFDLSPIEKCDKLKYLNISCGIASATKLDLTLVPIETYLGKDHAKLDSIYSNDTLRRITITNFMHENLQRYTGQNIERITIDGSKSLNSLRGIEALKNLKLVEIENCPNLKRPLLYVNDYPFLRIYVDGTLQK
jgi:hypothetical protein